MSSVIVLDKYREADGSITEIYYRTRLSRYTTFDQDVASIDSVKVTSIELVNLGSMQFIKLHLAIDYTRRQQQQFFKVALIKESTTSIARLEEIETQTISIKECNYDCSYLNGAY